MKLIEEPKFSISRRTLLAGAAIGATQIAAPFVITARAAEAIKIGLLLPKSGPYAVQGETGQNGAQIAVEDFGGHVLDRPIQIVWLDESSPQSTQQNMRKLIEEEKVVAIQGGVSSGDVLAIMPVAEQAKMLLMASGPNATEITGKNCNKYTFRVDLPNKVTVQSVYPQLKERGKKWYFIVASYAWGIDAYNQMKDVLVKDGGTVLGYDQAPLGTTDYSSYILKLRQAKPDVLYVGLGGTDLTNLLKQMHEIGLTRQMALSSPIVNDSDLWAAGPDAAFGTYPKLWNYTGPHLTKRSAEFVEAYRKKIQRAAGSRGLAGLVRHNGHPDRDQGNQVDRFRQAGCVPGRAQVRRLQGCADRLPQFRPPVGPAAAGGIGEGKDHRQIRLLQHRQRISEGPRPARGGIRQPGRHRLSIQELI